MRTQSNYEGDVRDHPAGAILAGVVSGALIVSALLVASAWRDSSSLGAPWYWPWLLTGLQVLALWRAGRGGSWGWVLGGSVQLPWMVYAVITDQLGFLPGCALSAAVQFNTALRATSGAETWTARLISRSRRPKEAMT